MQFGKMIKEERIKQGMSQKGLAEAAGVTVRAVIYWENGQRQMSIENADRIFRALHMSVEIGECPADKTDYGLEQPEEWLKEPADSDIMCTEFGRKMEQCILEWDAALREDRDAPGTLRKLAWCQAQWEVYKLALEQFLGTEYCFTRTDGYVGICTEDESRWLVKREREL